MIAAPARGPLCALPLPALIVGSGCWTLGNRQGRSGLPGSLYTRSQQLSPVYMSPSNIYSSNMFLSRLKDKLSVDLTMAVRSASAAVSCSEMAQVGEPSSSQSGCVRKFDMNRLPGVTDEEEEEGGEGGSSSAVSIVSPFLSPERDNHTTTTTTAPEGIYTAPALTNTNHEEEEEEEEGEGAGAARRGGGVVPPRKKLRLSKEQSALLEESFREHHTLNPKQKSALAKQLNLKSRQVEVWFQNRRARTKLKQTEVDCEFLKRCCESLTEENRRLQREVEELRAIKVGPPCVIATQDLYMPTMTMPMSMPLPAATLTMCPSCERLGTSIDKRALTFAKPSYYVTNFRQPSAAC